MSKPQTVHATDLSPLGAGVAKIGGKVIFVPDLIDGEEAEIEIVREEKRFCYGKILRRLNDSPYRIESDCEVWEACGGCTLRHIAYTHEAEQKRLMVCANLRRAGVAEEALPKEIVTGAENEYRNKVVFHISGRKYGFYSENSHTMVYPQTGCRLIPKIFDEIATFTAENADGKELMLRISEDRQITAVLTALKAEAEKWGREVMNRFPQICGTFYRTEEKTQIIPLYGCTALTDTFLSLTMHVSPAAFWQVNKPMAEKLVRTAVDFASPQDGEKVADLYCGTGVFGMTLAKENPHVNVTGIEIIPEAVRDATENAKANGIANIRFVCADSATAVKEGKFGTVIIDPPRAGCSAQARATLLTLAPKKIVYVSCNPATLARDIADLQKAGYTATQSRVFDLFPRTEHVETVVLLEKTETH